MKTNLEQQYIMTVYRVKLHWLRMNWYGKHLSNCNQDQTPWQVTISSTSTNNGWGIGNIMYIYKDQILKVIILNCEFLQCTIFFKNLLLSRQILNLNLLPQLIPKSPRNLHLSLTHIYISKVHTSASITYHR